MDYSLSYMRYPLVLEGYTDANWINKTKDNSSTSGCVFLLEGGAISWASKKQTYITSSTMESEFVALAVVGKEVKWLRNLILEIPLWPKPIAPIYIRCNSVVTLAKAYSQMYNEKSKHLGSELNLGRIVGKFSALEGSVHTGEFTLQRVTLSTEGIHLMMSSAKAEESH
ncbi:zinc finger, CCHC-type containing protein [Tanacetum coccineum]